MWYGNIKYSKQKLFIILHIQTRRSRGYCFIYFETLKSAMRAVESSDDLRIDSRYVRVDYSITNRPNSKPIHERNRDEYHRNMRSRNRSSSPSYYRGDRAETNWKTFRWCSKWPKFSRMPDFFKLETIMRVGNTQQMNQ